MSYRAVDYLERARQARARGDVDRCVLEATVASGLARREADDLTAYHAFACVGRMHVSRGEYEDATGWYLLALEQAIQHGLTEWEAPAHHDLFLCYRERGERGSAEKHLREAYTLYGQAPRLAHLLSDIETTEPRDRVHLIAPLLHPGYTPAPCDRDRLILLSQLSSAYAALGWTKRLEGAYDLMKTLLGKETEAGALSLCTLAQEAMKAGCYSVASEAAAKAEALAKEREEERISGQAAALLASPALTITVETMP